MNRLINYTGQFSLFYYQLCHLSLAQWQLEDTEQDQELRQQTLNSLLRS